MAAGDFKPVLETTNSPAKARPPPILEVSRVTYPRRRHAQRLTSFAEHLQRLIQALHNPGLRRSPPDRNYRGTARPLRPPPARPPLRPLRHQHHPPGQITKEQRLHPRRRARPGNRPAPLPHRRLLRLKARGPAPRRLPPGRALQPPARPPQPGRQGDWRALPGHDRLPHGEA